MPLNAVYKTIVQKQVVQSGWKTNTGVHLTTAGRLQALESIREIILSAAINAHALQAATAFTTHLLQRYFRMGNALSPVLEFLISVILLSWQLYSSFI